MAIVIGTVTAHQNVCENVPQAAFIRHPRGCSSYFVCWNGRPHARDCPPGLKFEVSGICDFPQFVDCGACSPYGFQTIRDPASCGRYILCRNGHATKKQCADGLHFDVNTLTCREAHLVNCTERPATTTPVPTTSNFTNFFSKSVLMCKLF